jgi:hypothetical protein
LLWFFLLTEGVDVYIGSVNDDDIAVVFGAWAMAV